MHQYTCQQCAQVLFLPHVKPSQKLLQMNLLPFGCKALTDADIEKASGAAQLHEFTLARINCFSAIVENG